MNLFTIPPDTPFLPSIVHHVLNPQLLAGHMPALGTPAPQDWTIFLPTRRAVRHLEASFAHAQTAPLLLPKLYSLGDSDEVELALSDMSDDMLAIPPALEPEARVLHMADLIKNLKPEHKMVSSYAQTMQLAQDLLALLDDSTRHGVALTKLDKLVPEHYAEHWQVTLALLQIISKRWPKHLKMLGKSDPIARQEAILNLQARYWRKAKGPVLLAGSTAARPAVRHFGKTIMARADGAIILPGLDLRLTKAQSQTILARHPAHPQYMMLQFLATLDKMPSDVQLWPGTKTHPQAQHLMHLVAPISPMSGKAKNIPSVSLIEAATLVEEAGVIACLMREAIETPGRKVALITPQRALTRAVEVLLRRWGIVADRTDEDTLADTTLGRLVGLLMGAVQNCLSFIPLLALVQSPLVCLGQSRAGHWRCVRELESMLRSDRDLSDRADVLASLGDNAKTKSLVRLHRQLTPVLQPLYDLSGDGMVTMQQCQAALISSLTCLLANDEQSGAERLEQQPEAEAVLSSSARYADNAPTPLPFADWARLLNIWLQAQPYRRTADRPHPRVKIMGVLESRLLDATLADRLILGGLNEGVWPMHAKTGSWLSRPMRQRLGFPALEQRIGQSAHDFVQLLASGQEVICTRARKHGSSPSPAARWIERLRPHLAAPPIDALSIWQHIHRTPKTITPVAAPAPAPALIHRPRQLSVTQIERLRRNPYEIYARKILGLEALEALDMSLDAARRGQFIHKIMELFQHRFAFPKRLPDDIPKLLWALAQELSVQMLGGAKIAAYWRARLNNLGRWLAHYEARQRANGLCQTFIEHKGSWRFALTQGEFTLTAHADRLDVFDDGSVHIIDYKTGMPPTNKQMQSGNAPQLPLEALILQSGGFEGIRAPGFAHIQLTHLNIAGDDKSQIEQTINAEDIYPSKQAKALRDLLEAYDKATTPYPAYDFATKDDQLNPYQHLARVQEWQGDVDVPSDAAADQ